MPDRNIARLLFAFVAILLAAAVLLGTEPAIALLAFGVACAALAAIL